MPASTSVTGRPPIPAMTTDAERECYYRLAKDAAGKGAIIELGAWLGASTAYIAAGIRDSGVKARVHVYDKFESKPAHEAKVKAFYDREGGHVVPTGHARKAFDNYLGPLLDFAEVHEGQIERLVSSHEPVALLISDAPKRVRAISAVLTKLHKQIVPGTVMAWQDFCHFPSYEIPACLYRIAGHLEIVEAIVPGTTMVFQVTSPWHPREVSEGALAVSTWTPAAVDVAWDWWLRVVPEEKRDLFECGKTMFLSDIGHVGKALDHLGRILDRGPEGAIKKWKYLYDVRPDLVARYRALFDLLEKRELLC